MKEGWEEKKIGDVIEHLRTGLNPRTHFKLNTPDADGYYITVRELKGFAIEPDEKTDKVNSAAIKRINERSNLKIGDVLFSGTGTIGKTALVSELPNKWNIKEGVYAMTPKHSELDSKWFIYYISSEFFLKLANDKAAGTGVRSIPMKELVKLPIHLPPLSEQQSIVDYLDSAFAKIDAMKANAEKALNEAKALFQASLKEMLEPKEGWEEKTLKEIVHPDCTLSYGIVQPGEHVEDGVPVVRPVDFNDKVIVRVEGLKRTKRDISEAYRRTILKGGEILLCVRGTTGTLGLASDELQGCNVTRGIVPIFFGKDVNKMFVFYQLLSPKLQIEIQKKTTGAALKQINIKDLRVLHLMLPPLSEQQSIVDTLDSLKSKVDRLQANFEKISQECDALKQAILRQVFE